MVTSTFYKNALDIPKNIGMHMQGKVMHQSQDVQRCSFLNQPCIVIFDAAQAPVAYAFLEINSFKRAHLWFGPVLFHRDNVNEVIQALIVRAYKEGIWHFTVHCEDMEVYKAFKFLGENKMLHVLTETASVAAAVKHIANLTESQLIKSYKTRLRKGLTVANERGLSVSKVNSTASFETFVNLFIQMYSQRNISMDFKAYRLRLLADLNYVLQTGNGSIFAAYLGNICLGCSVQIYAGKTAYYLCAATEKGNPIPIMHKIVHQAILEAIDAGCAYIVGHGKFKLHLINFIIQSKDLVLKLLHKKKVSL